jgi:hypothetical protein
MVVGTEEQIDVNWKQGEVYAEGSCGLACPEIVAHADESRLDGTAGGNFGEAKQRWLRLA